MIVAIISRKVTQARSALDVVIRVIPSLVPNEPASVATKPTSKDAAFTEQTVDVVLPENVRTLAERNK